LKKTDYVIAHLLALLSRWRSYPGFPLRRCEIIKSHIFQFYWKTWCTVFWNSLQSKSMSPASMLAQ